MNTKPELQELTAIFFDAGGTLIHLDAAMLCAILHDELRIRVDCERVARAEQIALHHLGELVAAGAGSTEKLKRQFYSVLLPEAGVPGDLIDAATACMLRASQREMLWRKTEEANPAILQALRNRGLRLAVVSNSDGRIELAFELAGLTRYFDFFVDSYLVGVEKPNPEIFRIALARAGAAPAEVAYVGDLYPVDVVGARQAGLVPILYDPLSLNVGADCLRIEAMSELLALTVR